MRICLNCGRKLEPNSHPRRRYCSDRCKMVAHRDPSVRMADEALEVLKPSQEMLVAGGFMDPGIHWHDRLGFLKLHYPTIWQTFGEDALSAAAQPLPAGTCRWCWSWALAVPGNRRKLLAKAMVTPGARRLLGAPCKGCTERVLKLMDARMKTGRSAAATRPGSGNAGGNGSRKSVLTASSAAALRPLDERDLHAHDRCVICKQRPPALLIASGDLEPRLKPHPPWFTTVDDYRRWVAAGRPKSWAAQ
jgi:hypothetical protein